MSKTITLDLRQNLVGLDGKHMRASNAKDAEPITLGKCVASMLNSITGFEKSEAVKLFRTIDSYYNDDSIDLDLDAIDWLAKKIQQVDNYTPYALGQVLCILDDHKDRLKKQQEPNKKELVE